MARPTKFNESIKQKILKLAAAGATDEEMSRAIGICKSTLNNWKGWDPDFFDQLKEAKDVADQLVVASLFQRAIGYRHPEIKVFCTKDGEILTKTVTRHHPPDVTACIFWLKNRDPKSWRERTGRDGDTHDAPALEQVKELAEWLQKLTSGEKK